MPVWMVAVEWLARLILLGLVGLSVWSIALIFERRRYNKNLDPDSFAKKLQGIGDRFSIDKVDHGISRELHQKKQEMEKGLPILGTLGATTPFIGLLGTILGIIVAFGELSQGKSDTNAIMFALAEALILTAVGLFVAIPAVIAFNHFKNKNNAFFDHIRSEMDFYVASRKDP